MKQKIFIYLGFFATLFVFSQKESLKLGDPYWEDQLYISVTYNSLVNQISGVSDSGFSYGLSLGYIKDIALNKKGMWAFGIGTGYNYDSFNHGLHVYDSGEISIANGTNDKIRLHNIEFPIQLRWRTSDSVTYTFWRIYAGVKLSYNFSNLFTSNTDKKYNICSFNKFQTGLELSVGYGTFSFYTYYGMSPMYKNIKVKNQTLNTRIVKFGLIFYLL